MWYKTESQPQKTSEVAKHFLNFSLSIFSSYLTSFHFFSTASSLKKADRKVLYITFRLFLISCKLIRVLAWRKLHSVSVSKI